MSAVETLQGYVNTWDCDENDHLNVRFYYRFFEDASDHFLARLGMAGAGRPRVRHVRYHAELRANAGVRVDSMLAASGDAIVHRLCETPSGRLSATCLETWPAPLPAPARQDPPGEVPDQALPRSLPAGPSAIGPGDGAMTLATRVRAGDAGPDGRAFDSTVIGFNSDAAAHFWSLAGIDRPWLETRGLGTVAVEMKLTNCAGLRFGDLVHVTSRPRAVARSTLTFENRFVRTLTGEVGAIVEVTALTMDLTARRAVPLPDDLREAIETGIAAATASVQVRSS